MFYRTAGQFKTSYQADHALFPVRQDFVLLIVILAFESCYTSISGILKAEMFPIHIRGLGVGFTYAVGNSLFGGSAEYVALGLKNAGHASLFPAYVTIMAAIGLVAISFLHDSRSHSTIDNFHGSAYKRK